MAEQILIEFVGDTSTLQPAIDVLAKTGQLSDKDAASFKNLGIQGSNAFKVIAPMAKSVIKSLGDVTNSAIKLSDTFTDNVAAGIQDGLTAAGVSIEDLDKALAKAGITTDSLADKTDNVTSSQTSLIREFRNTREELGRLKIAGQQNTQQYQDLTKHAGELESAIKHVSEEVSRAGSDTRGLDNLLQLAGGIAGGFAIAEGSVALFGNKNDELTRTLLKVNAAMAILQGLQQIQNVIRQKNLLSLTALIGAEAIETLQTNLQTAAESENIIVRYAAIAAQKALNAILALSPLGIVTIAVAGLAAAWAFFFSKAENAIDIQKKLNAELDQSLGIYDKNIEAIKNSTDLTIKQLESELKTRKEISAASQEGLSQQIEQAKQAKKQADDNFEIAFKSFGLKKKLNDDEAEQYKAATDKKNQADQKFYSLSHELSTQQFEQAKLDYEDSIKSHQGFIDAKVLAAQKGSIAEIDAQINAAKALEESTKKSNPDLTGGELAKLSADTNRQIIELNAQKNVKILNDDKALIEARIAATREGSLEELELQKQKAAKDVQIQLASIELSSKQRKAIIADGAKEQRDFDTKIAVQRLSDDQLQINTRLSLAKEGSVEEFSAKVDLLNNQEATELALAKGNADKKLEIDARYEKARHDLSNATDARIQTEALNDKQATTNKRISELQKLSTSQNNAELLQLKKDAVEQQAQTDIIAARESIKNEQLKQDAILAIRAKANADKLAIDQQAKLSEITFQTDIKNAVIDIEKKKLQAVVDTQGFNFKARSDAAKKIDQLTFEQLDNEQAALEKERADGLINEEDYNKKLLEINSKRGDAEIAIEAKKEKKKQAIIQAGFQILSEAVSTLFDIQNTARQADLDATIASLEARKDAEVNVKNLTEGQKAEIDAKFKAKEDAIKRKAFEADKQAKKQQAIISGALAAINALATAPTIIAGLILAAVVAADTAFQIAKINATQPPAFKKGTRNAPKGYKWVGEEGPELMWSKGGEVIYPYKQSMTIAEAWRGGSLAHADDILRGNIATPNQEVLSNISVNSDGGMSFSKDDLVDAIKEAIDIPEAVQVFNSIDANGLNSFIMNKGNRIKQLNKRHKIG